MGIWEATAEGGPGTAGVVQPLKQRNPDNYFGKKDLGPRFELKRVGASDR